MYYNTDFRFKGWIDEVAIFNVGLDTINTNLQGNELNLLYLWKFEEGSGDCIDVVSGGVSNFATWNTDVHD